MISINMYEHCIEYIRMQYIVQNVKVEVIEIDKNTKKNDITIDEANCNRQHIGECSEAEGCNTVSLGECSHAEGCCTEAKGTCSHSEGCCTKSVGDCSHAEGKSIDINGGLRPTKAIGQGAHAEGGGSLARGDYSHAEGFNTVAFGTVSHAEGISTQASGPSSHAEGCDSMAIGECSHVEGLNTTASGFASHAEGRQTTASGFSAHAEGQDTTASGHLYPHAEGFLTTASGDISHAEGFLTTAGGNTSHAEGSVTTASGFASHAEGSNTIASGRIPHAEGSNTEASGDISHAEGNATTASGNISHAEGNDTSTADFEGAHIMGQFGDACEDYGWFMAGGTNTVTRAVNACIKNSGDAFFTSINTIDPCCADYAEMFETVDGKAIDVGYFVTFADETGKIRKANDVDDYILGVTSATPAVLAGSTDYTWQNRYMRDKWGRIQYETVTIPEITDGDGKVIILERNQTRPILNPKYNCKQCYTPRSQRPEWVAVGLVGQVLVRDDGTCKAMGYCKPNKDGIATTASNGYRVIKRTDEDQILILIYIGNKT